MEGRGPMLTRAGVLREREEQRRRRRVYPHIAWTSVLLLVWGAQVLGKYYISALAQR